MMNQASRPSSFVVRRWISPPSSAINLDTKVRSGPLELVFRRCRKLRPSGCRRTPTLVGPCSRLFPQTPNEQRQLAPDLTIEFARLGPERLQPRCVVDPQHRRRCQPEHPEPNSPPPAERCSPAVGLAGEPVAV